LLWAVEFGLGGLFVHLLGLVFLARDARKFEPSVRHALWSVLTACAVSCMFNSSLYDDLIGDFFCLTLGLLCSLGLHQKPVRGQYQVANHPLTTPVS
jgi:hypothetical protein